MILQNLNNDFFHVLDYGIMVNDYGISSGYSNLRILIYHLNWRRPGGRGRVWYISSLLGFALQIETWNSRRQLALCIVLDIYTLIGSM